MSEVTALENQLVKTKELVERRDQVFRLFDNRDFKKLILEDFCRDECARYAQMSADPNLGANEREDALRMAQAAGHLRRFLAVVSQMGNVHEAQLVELEEAIAAARAEEDAGK